VLTGEHREYKPKLGTWGAIKPSSDSGAWEVGARFSFVNLNDAKGSIKGGSAHNAAISLSWYANEHIRVMSELIQSRMKKEINGSREKRKLNTFGLRLQAVF